MAIYELQKVSKKQWANFFAKIFVCNLALLTFKYNKKLKKVVNSPNFNFLIQAVLWATTLIQVQGKSWVLG